MNSCFSYSRGSRPTRRNMLRQTAAMALLATALTSAGARSVDWPRQPVRVIVPQAPGGGTDVLARLLAERLQAALGQPFVVENRTGAGGNIGTDAVAKAKPDGYTLLVTTNTHVTNVGFFAKLSYDPVKDFAPVSLIASIPFVMAVNASSPYHSIKDLVAAAKAEPGRLSYASGGLGTPHQLASELFKVMTGTDITHVPYRGSAPAAVALLGNEVSMSISAVNSMLPHLRTGRLRALGVATAARTPLLPDVPTIAEAAALPGYAIDIWYAVMAPAGTPRPIVERLNAEIRKVMTDPAVISEKLTPQGLDPVASSSQQLARVIASDLVKYRKLMKDAGIVAE